MIKFNIPLCVGGELTYVREAVESRKLCGDGSFTKKCNAWLEQNTGAEKTLLTTSCTHALEMAALLCGIQPGDEVIMPSYTFVSTANAFVLRGARIVFVDIRPDTMNINESLIEDAVTERTRAIVPVHYAGVACAMDQILEIARRHDLFVVEDAAQGMMCTWRGRPLGTIGDFGCFSFHETKNYTMGEGGALLLPDEKWMAQAEIIREKGTNRSRFYRGEIDKYSWVGQGSSYLPSELNAAYLYAQLEQAEEVNAARLHCWHRYEQGLSGLAESGCLELPYVPPECAHNAHMFYIKTADLRERTALHSYLKEQDICSVFHYVPLHSSEAGKRFGQMHGEDRYTTKESERLLRLPMYYGLSEEDIDTVITKIKAFYNR